MKFNELNFEPIKIDVMWLALHASGMGKGTQRAKTKKGNNYTLVVTKGSYLCTEDTYEVGILDNDEELMNIEAYPELNQKIIALGVENDGSGQFVYKEVSRENVEKIADILEKEDD